MAVDESYIMDRIGILGVNPVGLPFTFDGHTLQMFQSSTTHYFSWSRSAGTYISNDSQYNYLIKNNFQAMNCSSFFETPSYAMPFIKKLRDISGLDIFVPNPACFLQYRTANPNDYAVGWLLEIEDHYDSVEDEDYYTFAYAYGSNYWSETEDPDTSKNVLFCIDLDNPFIPRFGKLKFGSAVMSHTVSGSTNILNIA